MLHYPKIPDSARAPFGARCVAFEKLDGTNLHFDWDVDFGWHAFGMRRDAFDLGSVGAAAFALAHPELSDAATLFADTLAAPLDRLLRERPRFAGRHRADDPKRLALFDLLQDPGGFLEPEAFVAEFTGLPIPRVLFRGKLTGARTEEIRQGRYDVAEGAVIKGVGPDGIWRVKVKTNAYRQRLRDAFAEEWEAFWE